mgnify:CR=1 FL=1|jgi:Mg2+ and Co2+ transporter CorA|tara:strand:+ start:1521 stop:1775 length:255 start_codon:yes stop_codon:yes gene_type:complete
MKSLNKINNKMEKEKMNFSEMLKTKKATAIFAVISLVSGFYFIGQRITGNVILGTEYSLNLLPIIGMLLILCSIILGTYSLKKR